MTVTLLVLVGAFSWMDALAIWKAHRAEALSQVLEWVQPDSRHPALGVLYIGIGLSLVVAARAHASWLLLPCYGLGGGISFLGVRFFEPGFTRRFLENWVLRAGDRGRILLPVAFEFAIGLYCLTAAGLLWNTS